MSGNQEKDYELIPDFTIGKPTTAFSGERIWTDEQWDVLKDYSLPELKRICLGPILVAVESDE